MKSNIIASQIETHPNMAGGSGDSIQKACRAVNEVIRRALEEADITRTGYAIA